MSKPFIITLLLIINFLSASITFAAERKNAVIVKLGTFTMEKADQTIDRFNAAFEDSSTSVYDIEYNRKFGNNFAFGGEILHYTNKFTYAQFIPSETDSYVLTGNIKKYFAVAKHFEPFIGGGVGFIVTGVTGGLDGGAVGLAASLSAGIEIPFDVVGIHLEYRYLRATAENDTTSGRTAEFDLSGSALFAGVAIHF